KLSNCVALCRPASSCTFLMCCCVWRRWRSGCGCSPRRFTASSGTASCRASASVAWCASGRRTWRCSVRVITVRERPRIPAWLHARHLHALGRGELTVPDVRLAPAVLDDVLAFARAFGLGLYAWQQSAFGAACQRESGRFVHRLAGISVPRGNGKSFGGAVVGLWRLLCGKPPPDILTAAPPSHRP